jgi:endonuclease/exonuclease/phosphatase family metal-dependent hydrolase
MVRIYNCHLPIRKIGVEDRLKMIKKIIDHSDGHKGPTIICGDMNTTVPRSGLGRVLVDIIHRPPKSKQFISGKYYTKDERFCFNELVEKYGYKELLDLNIPTWVLPKTRIEYPRLKLDWFLTRDIETELLAIGPYISDHRPILAKCYI